MSETNGGASRTLTRTDLAPPRQGGDYCECCDPDVTWCVNRTPARTD